MLLMLLIIVAGLTVWRLNHNNTNTNTTSTNTPNSSRVNSSGGIEPTEASGSNSETNHPQTHNTGTAAADIRNIRKHDFILTPGDNYDFMRIPGDNLETIETLSAMSATTFSIPGLPADSDSFGPSKLNENSTVSTVGLDEVTFGLTVQRAQQEAGTQMIPMTAVDSCYHVVPYDAPEGIIFLVYEGSIERVDIVSGPITTRSGVGIGTHEDTIMNLFGDSIERRTLLDGTTDLIFVPSDAADSNYRVIFNMEDELVKTYKSGKIPQVLAETGCE